MTDDCSSVGVCFVKDIEKEAIHLSQSNLKNLDHAE